MEAIYPPGFTQELQFILQGGAQLEDNARAQRGSSLGYLITQRQVYGLALGWGAYNYTFCLLLTWLPSYLSVSLHLDLFHSIFYTSFFGLFATFTDLVVGGYTLWRSDWVIFDLTDLLRKS